MKFLRIAILAAAIVASFAYPTPQGDSKVDSSSESRVAESPVIKRVTKVEVEPVKQTEENSEPNEKVTVNVEVKAVPVASDAPTSVPVKEVEEKPSEVVKPAEVSDEVKKVDVEKEVEVDQEQETKTAAKTTVEKAPETDNKPEVEADETRNSEQLDTKKAAETQYFAEEQAANDPKKDAIKPVPIITFTEALAEYEKAQADKPKNDDVVEDSRPVATEVKKVEEAVKNEKTEAVDESSPSVKVETESDSVYKKIPVAVVQDDAKKEDVKVEKTETPESSVKTTEETKSEDTVKELSAVLAAANPVKVETSESDSSAIKAVEPEVSKPVVSVVVPSKVEVQESVKPANDETKVFIVEATQADNVEDSPKPVEPVAVVESEPQTKTKVEVQADEKTDSELSVDKTQTVAVSPVKVAEETNVKVAEVVKDEPVVADHGSSTKTATKDENVKKGTEDKGDGDSSAAKSSEELKEEKASDASAGESAPAPVKVESKSKGKKKLPANIRGYRKRLQQVQERA